MNALRNLTARQVSLIKASLFVLALLPFIRLMAFAVLDALGQSHQLGANPIEFITRNTGDWTLYLLTITLVITPLRRLTGWNWLIKLRRMFGLFAFFYAALHFMTFFWFDHFFDLDEMWKDVLKRPFITVGFIAFVLLIPLAATSTNAMVRRLGGKRWQWLHRLSYVIVPLGVLHFWWMKAGKNLLGQPILFVTIISALLLLRIFFHFRKKESA